VRLIVKQAALQCLSIMALTVECRHDVVVHLGSTSFSN